VTATVSIFIDKLSHHLSFVWVELTLATIAALVYFALSGRDVKSGVTKMKASSGSPQPDRQEQCNSPCYNTQLPQLESSDQEPSPVQLITKALRQGKIGEAVDLLQELPETKEGSVPEGLAHRLLMVVTRVPRSVDTMSRLKALSGKITSATLEAAMSDAVNNRDLTACRQLHTLSNITSIPKSKEIFEQLANVYSFDVPALHALVKEASVPLTKQFAAVVLEACAVNKDSVLVEEVFEKVHSADAAFLRKVVEKASAAEKSASGKASGKLAEGSEQGSSNSNSPRPEQQSAGDALSLRDSITESFGTKTTFQKEVAMRANDIRSCGKNGDLKGAIKVYERLGAQAENTLLMNSMLDACVECKDIKAALSYFVQAKKQGLADVVSYNTMMKGYISHGQESAAQDLLAELSHRGMAATRASFHGLLNARVNARDLKGAWSLVEEMQASGINPNAVTCSILLKGKLSSNADVSRVLALIEAMDQPMDEVLFLSVVEACIRTGRLDLLSRQTEKFLSQDQAVTLAAPTFGSMIKAYGHARDVKRVRELWNQMLAHRAQPTAVTLGCMIEALVANGCTTEAWQLAQKMFADSTTRPLVNTVIYSSILKGFANAKETDKVMALYEEMKAHEIQPNTITFNTILNAFAGGGAMARVPTLLEDMKKAVPPVEPDIVTYSTIVKGFCNCGSLDRALKVLKDMKASGKYSPDEVMYNSLLSGCAKEHRPDEALQLLNDMKQSGVAPSNYTLSMLVKLMGRCKRLNQAFIMLEDISKEYGLKINIQVYTCLIQGCFNAGQAGKAITLHDKIINDGLLPDAMTYTVLVRGCLQAGFTDKAVALVKCAYGLSTEMQMSKGTPPGLAAGGLDEVVAALGGPENTVASALKAEISSCAAASAGQADSRAPRRSGQTGARPTWQNKGPADGAGAMGYPARSTAKKMAERAAFTGERDWHNARP